MSLDRFAASCACDLQTMKETFDRLGLEYGHELSLANITSDIVTLFKELKGRQFAKCSYDKGPRGLEAFGFSFRDMHDGEVALPALTQRAAFEAERAVLRGIPVLYRSDEFGSEKFGINILIPSPHESGKVDCFIVYVDKNSPNQVEQLSRYLGTIPDEGEVLKTNLGSDVLDQMISDSTDGTIESWNQLTKSDAEMAREVAQMIKEMGVDAVLERYFPEQYQKQILEMRSDFSQEIDPRVTEVTVARLEMEKTPLERSELRHTPFDSLVAAREFPPDYTQAPAEGLSVERASRLNANLGPPPVGGLTDDVIRREVEISDPRISLRPPFAFDTIRTALSEHMIIASIPPSEIPPLIALRAAFMREGLVPLKEELSKVQPQRAGPESPALERADSFMQMKALAASNAGPPLRAQSSEEVPARMLAYRVIVENKNLPPNADTSRLYAARNAGETAGAVLMAAAPIRTQSGRGEVLRHELRSGMSVSSSLPLTASQRTVFSDSTRAAPPRMMSETQSFSPPVSPSAPHKVQELRSARAFPEISAVRAEIPRTKDFRTEFSGQAHAQAEPSSRHQRRTELARTMQPERALQDTTPPRTIAREPTAFSPRASSVKVAARIDKDQSLTQRALDRVSSSSPTRTLTGRQAAPESRLVGAALLAYRHLHRAAHVRSLVRSEKTALRSQETRVLRQSEGRQQLPKRIVGAAQLLRRHEAPVIHLQKRIEVLAREARNRLPASQLAVTYTDIKRLRYALRIPAEARIARGFRFLPEEFRRYFLSRLERPWLRALEHVLRDVQRLAGTREGQAQIARMLARLVFLRRLFVLSGQRGKIKTLSAATLALLEALHTCGTDVAALQEIANEEAERLVDIMEGFFNRGHEAASLLRPRRRLSRRKTRLPFSRLSVKRESRALTRARMQHASSPPSQSEEVPLTAPFQSAATQGPKDYLETQQSMQEDHSRNL